VTAEKKPAAVAMILVPEFFQERHLDRLRTLGDVHYDPDLYADRPRLEAAAEGADVVVIRNRTRIDEPFLAHAPRLRLVGRLGAGLDNIDVPACERAGVRVRSVPGGNAVAVAEFTIGAILTLVRGTFAMTSDMLEGRWPRQGSTFGHQLHGQVLGVVGLGSIGRRVAARAAAFEMQVVACDPYLTDDDPAWSPATRVTLADLLGRADIVTVHVPLNDETRHLIGRAEVAAMKPGAILLNTSRGGVVDEVAVAAALRSGELGGAALDVFDSEPLGGDGRAVFAGIDNLLLSPHVAGNTQEAIDFIATTVIDAVEAELTGTSE
jgi:(S)-sulfolactate dehydrogenase